MTTVKDCVIAFLVVAIGMTVGVTAAAAILGAITGMC